MPATSRPIVAIDGPAGAGKSSVARLLAERLGYTYIDTGAMYRAVALFAQRGGVEFDDADRLAQLAQGLQFDFDGKPSAQRLRVCGDDVSDTIRSPDISRASSQVSCCPGVRSALVEQQRRLAASGGVVVEGRDIGTVVFPDAQAKIYLTASEQERARRRTSELAARGVEVDPARVLQEVRERDRRDMEREHSPLRPADDAIEFVTDGMSLDEVLDGLEAIVRERETG